MNKTVLLLGAGLLLPLSALAGPSYNYIQGDYIIDGDAEISGAGSEGYDGWSAKFSGEVLPHLIVQGQHSEIDIDNTDEEQDFNSIAVGGYLSAFSNNQSSVDVYGTVSYELLNDAVDASGYGFTLGLRMLPIKYLEINPFVSYVDYGQIENTGGIDADLDGLRYGVELIGNINERLGITASYRQTQLEVSPGNVDVEFNDEFLVGLRLNL